MTSTERARLIATLSLVLVRLSDEDREARRDATALVVDGEEIEPDAAAEAA